MKKCAALLFILVLIMALSACTQQVNSVVDAEIDGEGHLLLTLTDGTILDAGVARGEDGRDGANGLSGEDGIDGKDGLNGKDGADGSDGHNGLDGTVLTVSENGDWEIDGKDSGIMAGYLNPKVSGIEYNKPYRAVEVGSEYSQERGEDNTIINMWCYTFKENGTAQYMHASYSLQPSSWSEEELESVKQYGVEYSLLYQEEPYYIIGFEGDEETFILTDTAIEINNGKTMRVKLLQSGELEMYDKAFSCDTICIR